MNEISKAAKDNQLKLMVQILSLNGSLLTPEQKQKVMEITNKAGILEGFKTIDNFKTQNSFKIK